MNSCRNTCHLRVCRTRLDLHVCLSRAWRASSARDTLVQLLAYWCTPRVYLLYSYCRLACACTILRVCSYIDTHARTHVLAHCFACCCTLLRVCAEDSMRENFNLLMSGTVSFQLFWLKLEWSYYCEFFRSLLLKVHWNGIFTCYFNLRILYHAMHKTSFW